MGKWKTITNLKTLIKAVNIIMLHITFCSFTIVAEQKVTKETEFLC